MSHPINEQQVPSTSPSHPHLTPSSTVENTQIRANPENLASPGRHRTPGNPNIFAAENAAPNPGHQGHQLREFHSLLEAAQRIANSAPLDTEGYRWREDDQPEPIIYLNRRRAGELSHARVPLTRQYSGRPHVPGEDSGSEAGMDDNEESSEMDLDRGRESPRPSSHAPSLIQTISDGRPGIAPSLPTSTDSGEHPQSRIGHVRTRDGRQGEEEERDLLEQALARSRAARSRFEADIQRPNFPEDQRTRYSTTAPSPTRESFYDWAPESPSVTGTSSNTSWQRSRATSTRRWRPTERLQDYARRDSTVTAQTSQSTEIQPSTGITDPWESSQSPRAANPNSSGHGNVVDRVERAFQQYRMARRTLRPQNDETRAPSRILDSPRPSLPRALSDRAPLSTDVTGNGDPVQVTSDQSDNANRSDLSSRIVPSAFGTGDIPNPSTTIRQAIAGRERRDDPLRQRIREQARERRRRVLQSFEQENARESLARGPLFDGAASSQSYRPQIDTRRMLEKIRLEETRARSAELRQAKAALHYLARLREPDMDQVKAWTVASELGLHNQSLDEDLTTNLAMSVNILPEPTYSSWLEPGMTWVGVQDANDAKEIFSRPRQPILHDLPSTTEQTRYAESASPQHESFRTRIGVARDRLERTLLGDGNADPIRAARSSMQVLEDAERSLTSMLERSEELLRENERQLRDNEEQLRQNRERLRDTDRRLLLLDEAVRPQTSVRSRQRALLTGTSQPTSCIDSDRWNVKVTLHSVDMKQMTVSGTMTASHKINQSPLDASTSSNGEIKEGECIGTSMDSFFTGDIIDFTQHGLDTVPRNQSHSSSTSTSTQHRRQQDDWRVGGSETDLSYWAGIGPFKHEVDHAVRKKEMQSGPARAMQSGEDVSDKSAETVNHISTADQDSGSIVDGTGKPTISTEARDQQILVPLSEDEKYAVTMDTMARLLCDTEWLNENIGAQGWILMRWKERCFVSPGTGPNPDVRRPWIPSQSQEVDQSAHLLEDDDGNGRNINILLTARDMLLQSRHRDGRSWSTNAAEREELANSRGVSSSSSLPATRATAADPGSRQPTWGLTISGFYYVALERKTGHIEALYYDWGSTPFQRLKMDPKTLYTAPRFNGQQGTTDTTTTMTLTSSGNGGNGGIGDIDLKAGVDGGASSEPFNVPGISGLRTNFNIVEFR